MMSGGFAIPAVRQYQKQQQSQRKKHLCGWILLWLVWDGAHMDTL